MNRSKLKGLLRNIGKLKPAKAATVKMNEKSLTGLLTKIKHTKQDLNEVANDEALLFRVFIGSAQAKWKNDEGNEISTLLEYFLTDDDIEEIIEQKQIEIRSHIDRLTALETKFNLIINNPRRKGRRTQILAALDVFATYSQTNARIEPQLPQTSNSTERSTVLEILINRIIKDGTGAGCRKGIQLAETRKRDEFIVNSGRNYNKKYGNPPAISRSFVTADAIQTIGGPFVRHAMADEDAPEHLNPTQIAESVRRIKNFMKESPDHPDGFLSESRPTKKIFSVLLKSNK